jgi:hypothetical protein
VTALVDRRKESRTNLEWKPQEDGSISSVYRGLTEVGYIAGTYTVARTGTIYQTSFRHSPHAMGDTETEVLYRGQTVEGALDAADDHYLRARRINGWLWCTRHLDPPMDPHSIEAMRIASRQQTPIRRGWLPD